jgi:polar amino acid transport system permease protein
MSGMVMAGVLQQWDSWLPRLLTGLRTSVEITGLALAIGLPTAMLLALASLSTRRGVRALTNGVIELGRGVPSLVALEFLYFGLPQAHVTLSATACAVAAFAIATAAYTSEMFRAGIQALPRGQTEAAQALGLSYVATNRFIIVPQAARIVVGPVLGFGILVFQGTSIAVAIAVPELLSKAYEIGSDTFEYLSVLVLAGLLYACIALPSAVVVRRLEARLSRGR